MLIALSLLSLTLYLAYAVGVCGIPSSVSHTYYLLARRGRPAWFFQAAMICTGGLLFPAWVEMSPVELQPFVFLSCASLVFVGASPLFIEGHERAIHLTATAIAGLSSLLWSLLLGYWLVVLLSLFVAVIAARICGKWLYCIELAAFVSAYTSIIHYHSVLCGF